jgi:hypothetical protein
LPAVERSAATGHAAPAEKSLRGPVRSALIRAAPLLMVVWFASFTLIIARAIAANPVALFGEPGVDVTAATTWLAGGDPWSTPWNGIRFAGPPTMLVPFVPFTVIGAEASRWIIGPVGVAAAVVAIRRLDLPLWWLAWPPLFYAMIHGSFDALLPLLIIGGAGPAAAFVKPYAAVLLRPRELLVLGAMLAVSAPFLPWLSFLERVGDIAITFRAKAIGLSVWENPLAIVAVLLAAWRVGTDARWLIVPALWPLAQFHYGAMALPFVVTQPWLAVGMAVPLPGAAAATLIAWGVWHMFRSENQGTH